MELGDAEDADDVGPFRPPLPPEDRLWRHPSELGAPVTKAPRRSPWLLAAVAGMTGAALTVGTLAAVGLLGRGATPREVVVREAVSPATGTLGDVAQVVAATAPAVVRIDAQGIPVASGVLFRDDGHVLTVAAAVAGAGALRAVLGDGRSLVARVVGSDAESGIAVLKLDGAGPFRTAMLGSTDGVAVGQLAIAVAAGPSVSTGVVSALGRDVTLGGGRVLAGMIATDAALPATASGGPLVDGRGAVLGITASAKGVGYAVPVEVARVVADELLQAGRVRTVWLGVRGEALPEGATPGIRIVEVAKGSPAELAGMRAGDTLREVDGNAVGSMSSVRTLLRRHHPSDRVTVAYDRRGVGRTAVLTLVERPAA